MLKKILKKFLIKLPLRKILLFESCPDFSDNTLYVFKEFIKRNYNKKYKMYWICEKSFVGPKLKNVKYIERNKHRFFVAILNHTASIVISCNNFLGVDRSNQESYYLMHGSPMKNVTSYYTCPSYIKYMITAGEYMNEKSAKAFQIDKQNCFPLGFPRNDVLVKPRCNLKNIFGEYKKIIIWYPTVKQFKSGRDCGVEPIPFFENENNIMRLNRKANEDDILIVIKPHFAQIENINVTNYSNIIFINEDFLENNHLTSYELLSASDALLTDYSSVAYDYMICNKPIGLIWYDIEKYSKNVGLYDYYEESTKGCVKLYDLESLISFISNVAKDNDEYKEIREKTCEKINAPKDEKNAKRVVDFIVANSGI